MFRRLSFIIVSDTELTSTPTLRPEAVQGWRSAGHAIVGEEEPETEDRLGEDVKNGVTNNLSVDTDELSTFSKTPDTGETVSSC